MRGRVCVHVRTTRNRYHAIVANNGEPYIRSISIALLTGLSTCVYAHPGHGFVVPHLHAADGYLLLGIGFGAAILAAVAIRKLK